MASAGGRRRRGLLRLQPRRRSGNRYARGPRRETGAAGLGLRLLRLILTAAAAGGRWRRRRRRRRSAAQAPTVKPRETEVAQIFKEGLSCLRSKPWVHSKGLIHQADFSGVILASHQW